MQQSLIDHSLILGQQRWEWDSYSDCALRQDCILMEGANDAFLGKLVLGHGRLEVSIDGIAQLAQQANDEVDFFVVSPP